jgi:uncharacterized membrane protein
MFGRNGAKSTVVDTAGEVSTYGGDVLKDEKARRRLVEAVTAGMIARRRAQRQTGMLGAARRLAEDPVFRAQAIATVTALQRARRRVERRRSHRLRNGLLVLGGTAVAVAAVPPLRRRVLALAGMDQHAAPGGGPTAIAEEIEVEAPRSAVYDQWTQFEEFPRFMDGVESVEQLDDTRLRWVAKVGGRRAEWEAKILHQEPDQRIGWQSTDGKQTTGVVTFTDAGAGRTRVRLAMTYVPEGALEQAGSALGLDLRRIRGDLQRFKELIEERGAPTGAWRGRVEGGRTTSS